MIRCLSTCTCTIREWSRGRTGKEEEKEGEGEREGEGEGEREGEAGVEQTDKAEMASVSVTRMSAAVTRKMQRATHGLCSHVRGTCAAETGTMSRRMRVLSAAISAPTSRVDSGMREDGAAGDDESVPSSSTSNAYAYHLLKNIPQVQRGDEAFRGASKRAHKRALQETSSKKKGPRPKAKPADVAAAHRIELFTQELCAPLSRTMKAFPDPKRLHPFERSLLELSLLAAEQNSRSVYTASPNMDSPSGSDYVHDDHTSDSEKKPESSGGEKKYLIALKEYDAARRKMHNVGRESSRRVKKYLQPRTGVDNDENPLKKIKGWATMSWKEREDEAVRYMEEEIGKTWNKTSIPAINKLMYIVKVLRRLPVVEIGMDTIALVGAPNVGKSSLVRILSSGKPEVREYPFTTKGIIVGHFDIVERRCQITDTPGVLPKRGKDRNAMEMLTLASLQHLPTSVVFVIDPTGSCGTSTADQLLVRQELKKLFPEKSWIDVLSKSDLVNQLKQGNDMSSEMEASIDGTDVGLTPLAREMSIQAEIACPQALKVSAVTNEGIQVLKQKIEEVCVPHNDNDEVVIQKFSP